MRRSACCFSLVRRYQAMAGMPNDKAISVQSAAAASTNVLKKTLRCSVWSTKAATTAIGR